MSRIGSKPIPIPNGVKVAVTKEGVSVQGPKGRLTTRLPKGIKVEEGKGELKALVEKKSAHSNAFWGLARSLVANAVQGVSEGFSKELDIVGIGYRAEVKGKTVVFSLGYSHPVIYAIRDGIEIKVDQNTHITVSGADKQLVGQTAAEIRSLRKPDPYKLKGIRYTGEYIRKKAGKTGV